MRAILLACAAGALAACDSGLELVTPIYLAPESTTTPVSDRPTLDVLVRMESDATDFAATSLMRLHVDGVDRTDDVVLGGFYGVLRLDPAPSGPTFVELSRRTGPVIGTTTWTTVPFDGPTLTGVDPVQARENASVTLTGTGFDGGPLRVWFGGVEGTVEASGASSITARVPAGASPGPVWVTVGAEAAEGLVGFTPLDAADQPLPFPDRSTLFACFPASAPRERAVRIHGFAFDDLAQPVFNGKTNLRVFGIEVVDLPGAGEILSAWAVPEPGVPAGAGDLFLRRGVEESNALPFTIEP